MKKFFKYFIFIIFCIFILNVFSFHQVKAEDELDDYVYKNGDLRCPSNSANSKCELINDGKEAIITHTENNVVIKKHVKKTETVGRYKIWFEIQNNDKATTQVVSTDTYVYFVVDASSTNQSNLGEIKKALNKFYSKLEEKNIYFSGSSFANGTKEFSETFKTSSSDLKINLDPSGSTSHIYNSLNNAVSMFNNSSNKAEDKKVLVILGDGLYYRCTDFYSNAKCGDNDRSTNQEKMLKQINTSLAKLRNQGVELYFIKYGDDGSKGYSYYQNLYDLPDNYFDKSRFLSNASSCIKANNCREYKSYKLMYRASSGNDVTVEFVKYIIRAGNGISVGNDISGYYINASNSFEETLTNLANKINNSVKEVNINYNYLLRDNIYESFITEETGLQGGNYEYRISSDGVITTDAFYIKISENLKNIDNDDGWYNTNDGFSLSFKKDDKVINITSNLNPQVYWVSEKLIVDSCLGVSQYDKTYDLTSKYYNIECKEGYDNKNGFVAKFNVGGLTTKATSFQTGGFGFPITIDLSTNIKCTYEFKSEAFKNDYNDLNTCMQTNQEDTPEYASCYKKKEQMEKIVNNYINLVGNSTKKGLNLEEYITDFENINGNLVLNYNDKTSDSLTFITSNFLKNIECSSETSTTLINNKTVYTNFSCTLNMSKKLELDDACLDMKTGNKTTCNNSTLSGGKLYYMDLDKKSASIHINIYNTGYMGNVGVSLQNCSASQSVDYNIVYRQIDLNDPFLEDDKERTIGQNYLNSTYNFTKIINDTKRTDGTTWENKFNYLYQISKVNVLNIRENTNEEGVSSYLGRDCYISNYQYKCSFTRNENQENMFTKVEINF